MGSIILGIIVVIIGALITIYSDAIFNAFGTIPFFDKYLGTEGGGRLGYKLIGIICLIVGIIMMTGSGNAFMIWLLGPLLQYSQPK